MSLDRPLPETPSKRLRRKPPPVVVGLAPAPPAPPAPPVAPAYVPTFGDALVLHPPTLPERPHRRPHGPKRWNEVALAELPAAAPPPRLVPLHEATPPHASPAALFAATPPHAAPEALFAATPPHAALEALFAATPPPSAPAPPPAPPLAGILSDLSFDDFLAPDSPKPMGPRAMPEYASPEPPYPVDSPPWTPSRSPDAASTPSRIPPLIDTGSLKRTSWYRLSPSPPRERPWSALLSPGRSTRSPSPRKLRFDRSPSLMHYEGVYGDDAEGGDAYGPYEPDASGLGAYEPYDPDASHLGDASQDPDVAPSPHGASPDGSYCGPDASYQYAANPASPYPPSPYPPSSPHYFDYLILPELPTETPSPKRTALALTLSLYAPPPAPARRDHDLPPVPLDLPQLPFSALLLSTPHFAACARIWLVSSVQQWCVSLATWLQNEHIPRRELKKALIKLVVFHRTDIPLDVVGQNVEHVMEVLGCGYSEGETEGFRLRQESVSGVLTVLLPCYGCGTAAGATGAAGSAGSANGSASGGTSSASGASGASGIGVCYSPRCPLNEILAHQRLWQSTNLTSLVLAEDWAAHWKLTADDIRRFDRDIPKRQLLIFDLLRYEQTFIERGRCFVDTVAPAFVEAAPALGVALPDDVLESGAELVSLHQHTLFEPLLRVLVREGKFVRSLTEIASLYRQWATRVRAPLLRYIATMPAIEELLRHDKVKRWVDGARSIPQVKRLKVNGALLFLSTFNLRYQQLPLQLGDVRLMLDAGDPEHAALTRAIDAIKRLGASVNDAKRLADTRFALRRLARELVWKSLVNRSYLNLELPNRRVCFRGDLTRKGDLKITSYNSHVVLLDNFLVITERLKGGRYRVTENPIPVELLMVEVAVAEQADGAAGGAVAASGAAAPDFSFKVRYAGRGKANAHTFTTSHAHLLEWTAHLMRARSALCRRLTRTEAYALRPVGGTFAYDAAARVTKLPLCAPDDPVEPAAEACRRQLAAWHCRDVYAFDNAKYHLIFGKVRTVAAFRYRGAKHYLVGLDLGVYCAAADMRAWKRVISGPDITALAVDADTNLVVVLALRRLHYYLLDLVVSVYAGTRDRMTSVAISNELVAFFAIGKHRHVTMLFYAKRKTNAAATNFKVLIPELDHDGVFSAFKVAKKFVVQAECYGVAIFNTSFAVLTTRGFEVLELDKLVPRTIPEATDAVEARPGRPMGMYKLANNAEFLLVYDNCAVFTNKHGKVSRALVVRFDFRARRVAFSANHLFLFCDEVMEVWAISDVVGGANSLVQVVVGKDVTMVGEGEAVTVAMANPKVPGLQMVFELVHKA